MVVFPPSPLPCCSLIRILLWDIQCSCVSELEFNIPFQHKHGYIRDECMCVMLNVGSSLIWDTARCQLLLPALLYTRLYVYFVMMSSACVSCVQGRVSRGLHCCAGRQLQYHSERWCRGECRAFNARLTTEAIWWGRFWCDTQYMQYVSHPSGVNVRFRVGIKVTVGLGALGLNLLHTGICTACPICLTMF